MFLKRSNFGHITAEDLYLGATLNVFSRQVKIVEYADVFTRNELEGNKSRTLALVKPDAYPHLGKIIAEVYKMGFVISKMKMVKLSKEEAAEFYSSIKGEPFTRSSASASRLASASRHDGQVLPTTRNQIDY